MFVDMASPLPEDGIRIKEIFKSTFEKADAPLA